MANQALSQWDPAAEKKTNPTPSPLPGLIVGLLMVVALIGGLVYWWLKPRPAPGERVSEICQTQHDNQSVTVSGYLGAPFLSLPCEGSCLLYLLEDPDERDGALISVTFPVGAGPGKMDPIRVKDDDDLHSAGEIKELNSSDFRLRDDASQLLSIGDAVRLTGTLHVRNTNGRSDCSLDPSTVHAL